MSYWDQYQPANYPTGGVGYSTQMNQPGYGPTTVAAPPAPTMTPNQAPANPSQPAPSGGGSTGGTASQDPQAFFQSAIAGVPATSEGLWSIKDKLASQGIQVLTNASGVHGKIKLPNGQIIDVIQSAGAGGGNWQWLGGGGGGSSAGGGGGSLGSMGNFETGMFTGGGQYPLASVKGEGLAAPWLTPFNAPDPNSITNDVALQWQMGRGRDAIERSAASKGTLLTGGLLKKLDEFGQGLASTYYNDVYNRKLGEYQLAHNIFRENQGDLYSRLFGVADLGQSAAANVGNAIGSYGDAASGSLGAIGNANAAGSAAQGNIWGNAVGGLGQSAMDIWLMNQLRNQRMPASTGSAYSDSSGSPGIGG